MTPTRLALASLTLIALVGCNAPRSLPSVREAGDRAFNQSDYQAAATHYEEYVLRKPGEPAAEAQFARTLLQLGDSQRAIGYAQAAYDAQPNNADYSDLLAESYLASGQTDQMYTFLRGNTEGRGSVSDFIRLGRFTAKAGDADGAEQALLTAARIDGGKSQAPQLALADFYKSIGDKASEKKRLRMALSFDVTSAPINARLRELGEIPGPSLALTPAERN